MGTVNQKDIEEIRNLRRKGVALQYIANQFQITPARVCQLTQDIHPEGDGHEVCKIKAQELIDLILGRESEEFVLPKWLVDILREANKKKHR